MSDEPTPDTPLGEVIDFVFSRIEEGIECPCCEQFAKVYERKLTVQTAKILIRMHLTAGTGPVYMPDLGHGGDPIKARYWGLIVEHPSPNPRDDGSTRNGWWGLTDLGEKFVLRLTSVPKYARIYDGNLLGLSGEMITIVDALGTKFRYDELMRGI